MAAEVTWFVVRADGRLDRSAADLSLAGALAKLGAQEGEHVAWGTVQARDEATARVMDPARWYGTARRLGPGGCTCVACGPDGDHVACPHCCPYRED